MLTDVQKAQRALTRALDLIQSLGLVVFGMDASLHLARSEDMKEACEKWSSIGPAHWLRDEDKIVGHVDHPAYNDSGGW